MHRNHRNLLSTTVERLARENLLLLLVPALWWCRVKLDSHCERFWSLFLLVWQRKNGWKLEDASIGVNSKSRDCHDFLGWRKIFILLQKRILMNLWKVRPSLDYDCDSYRNIFSLRNFTHSVFISVQQKLEKLQTHIDIVERQWQLHYDSITNCIQYT